MIQFHELSLAQRRSLIDARQIYDAWREARRVFQHRYAGSMRWLARRGHEYLHRKHRTKEVSLGRRGPATEAQYTAFVEGRAAQRQRLATLAAALDEMAPVHRALQLGRVPRLTSRIVRRLDDAGLLGTHVSIVGTNALFGYESAAGVLLDSGLLATGDADLLWDPRRRITLLAPEVRSGGIIDLLVATDRTFQLRGPGDFRAVNDAGFCVDLIRPQDTEFLRGDTRDRLADNASDRRGVPIFGLQWLLHAPKFEAVTIGEDGYPVRWVTPDPRAYALHKLWISTRDDRDPVKRVRDRRQAEITAEICRRYLALPFDPEDLRTFPLAVRALLGTLPAASEDDVPTPKW
jgi:hypothetical protein